MPVDPKSLLEQRLTDLEASFRRRHKDWLAPSVPQESLVDVMGRERSARVALEQRLAEVRNQLARREAEYRVELARADAMRAMVDEQFREAGLEVVRVRAAHSELEGLIRQERATRDGLAADVERLTQREADLTSQLSKAVHRFREETTTLVANARAKHAQLEDEISRTGRAHEIQLAQAREQHESELAMAAATLAAREAQLQAELSSLTAARDSLIDQLATSADEFKVADERAVQRLLAATTKQEELEARLTSETAAREALESATTEARSAAAAAEAALHAAEEEHRSALANAAARLAEREAQLQAELSHLAGARDSLTQQLADAVTALKVAEERATREQLIASKRQGDLEATLARETKIRESLETALAYERSEVTEMRTRCQVLQIAADRVPGLEQQLTAGEAESRRQFEMSPVAVCRFTADARFIDANHAFAALLGYRTFDQLRSTDVVATIFESPDDLSWLVGRSAAGKSESVETTCLMKNRTRIAVRLTATASPSAVIEITAEDLTAVHVLEDRLAKAHRMEAVGRLASEVAATCGKLLGDVQEDLQRLMTAGESAAQRHRAETILADVTRVGSFLQQLHAYGNEQAAALAPVDLNTVLRDLEPVLKQVAGDDVALELRPASSPLTVDVKADRVERLLVNVAGYGRERMPAGGRLRIELTTAVADRNVMAQYPDIRQGPHALITVTEVARPSEPRGDDGTSGRPGVDLGALQELITACGGHLWITAEPGGSMVVKMRLPLRATWDEQPIQPALRQSVRGRVTSRWFGR